MKYLRYLLIIVAFGFLASQAKAKLSPIVINLTASQQSLYNSATYTTNITATSTNLTLTAKYTATNTVINNAKIIKMLANSFNTNLPATAVLKFNDNGEVVVVVGTNVILNASSVIHINFLSSTPSTVAGSVTQSQKVTPTTSAAYVRAAYTDTAIDSFSYDDSSLSPADGKHTNFSVEGARTLRITQTVSSINSVVTYLINYIFTLSGAGDGTISDKAAVIKGVVTGNISVSL